MKVSIRVKANSKESKVEKTDNGLIVKVKAMAKEGKANKEVVEVLAKYFAVSKSSISIVSGASAKNKIVSIE
ncbi:MAG: DUF167 domain-containing protein [Planctomycetota bacterium]